MKAENFGKHYQIVPSLRFYSQSAAEFHGHVVDRGSSEPYSDDYRLSSYGALTYGLKAITSIDSFTFILSAERYESEDALGVGDGESSPSLVNFSMLTLGIDYEFN